MRQHVGRRHPVHHRTGEAWEAQMRHEGANIPRLCLAGVRVKAKLLFNRAEFDVTSCYMRTTGSRTRIDSCCSPKDIDSDNTIIAGACNPEC